jgi:hypothetical protein
MKKSLISLIALSFAFLVGSTLAAEKPVAKEDPVAKACKGKKAGDEVTVDDKKVKCPAAKKDDKKKK